MLLSLLTRIQHLATPVEGFLRRTKPDDRFRPVDQDLRRRAIAGLRSDDYEVLFAYLLAGQSAYGTSGGAGILYPGLPSRNGRDVDGLEGFARLAPIIAAWIAGGRDPMASDAFGQTRDLKLLLADGLRAGIRPGPTAWGQIGDHDQRTVEAASIALALWLSRDWLPTALGRQGLAALLAWLDGVRHAAVPDNNWYLFVVFVDRVLGHFGWLATDGRAGRMYARLKSFHLGSGWFKDGPDPASVDYYNVWMHFLLSMIDEVDPEWDPDFIAEVTGSFVESYARLFTVRGVPLFGRSICYRMATPLPLVMAARAGTVDKALARRCLDIGTGFFVANGALKAGVPTQGYFGTDERLVDIYTGPGGPLWSTYAVAMALLWPAEDSFWTSPARAPLAVEEGDFEFELPGAGLLISGEMASGNVAIERRFGVPNRRFKALGKARRLTEAAARRPVRPGNHAAKYPVRVTAWPPIWQTDNAQPQPFGGPGGGHRPKPCLRLAGAPVDGSGEPPARAPEARPREAAGHERRQARAPLFVV